MTDHVHRAPGVLLSRAVGVLVVGCGGTGSAVANGLADLHHAMIARGHPAGLKVVLCDGDDVSPTNTVRQAFSRSEVGHNKAHILASRANTFWGFDWEAVPRHLNANDNMQGVDVVIGAVDSRAARALIDDLVTRLHSPVHYWLDFGNLAGDGQYVLGQPHNGINHNLLGRLPTAAELYPEIIDPKGAPADVPSCSAAEAITRQRPFLNRILANYGLSLLDLLFSGGITHHGGHVRLVRGDGSTRLVTAMPVPALVTRDQGSLPQLPGAVAKKLARAKAGAA